MKATLDTALGQWELSGHAMERITERNPFTEEEFTEALKDPVNVKTLMVIPERRRVLSHVLVYVKGAYFVVVLSRWADSPWTVVVTMLSEKLYRQQTYAVNLSSHIEDIDKARKKAMSVSLANRSTL